MFDMEKLYKECTHIYLKTHRIEKILDLRTDTLLKMCIQDGY